MTEDRGFYIRPGHRGPRSSRGPRSAPRSTVEVIQRVKDQLTLVGPIHEEKMHREVLAISRQRHHRLVKLLTAEQAIVRTGRPLVWSAGPYLDDLKPANVVKRLEPRVAASATHPGQFQVDCTLCGLRGRPFPSPAAAREWYYWKHIKTGVAHADA